MHEANTSTSPIKMVINQWKKILAIALFVGLCAMPVMAETISQRMSHFELSGLQYYSYYLSTWLTKYNNYPFVVKISVTILIFCVFSILFLTFSLLRDRYFNKKHAKFYHKIKEKYYDSVLEVSTNRENLTDEEIIEYIGITEKDKKAWKKWRMLYIGKLLVEVKSACYETYNFRNIERLVRVFGLQMYIENILTFGRRSNRVQAMRIAQFLMMNLPESILVRLLDSGTHALRKEVRMYYLWLSDYSPFRFFTDKNVNYEYRPWDALEVHHLLRNRKIAGKEIPSLLPIVSICNDKQLKACLIREVAFWGNKDEVIKMGKYITAKDPIYRRAAIQCMGIAKCQKAEILMEEAYPQQTEKLKCETLKTLLNIQSNNSVPFFIKAYSTSTVRSTKLYALVCLWLYSAESKEEFSKLEQSASQEDLLLFEEVRAFNRNIRTAS